MSVLSRLTTIALLAGVVLLGACSASSGTPDVGIPTSGACGSSHEFVGRSRSFETYAHGVTGTVTVVDDCTMEVTGFNYDGGGPSVFMYAGINRDFNGTNAFALGPRLNGTAWSNDSLTLKLPEGKTFDDFDSLSVWCYDFNANFGDVYFASQQ